MQFCKQNVMLTDPFAAYSAAFSTSANYRLALIRIKMSDFSYYIIMIIMCELSVLSSIFLMLQNLLNNQNDVENVCVLKYVETYIPTICIICYTVKNTLNHLMLTYYEFHWV